jgi:hypothetical protein
VGRERERVSPHSGRPGSSGKPGPHEFAIERIPLRGLGAQGFGRWLDQWKDMQAQGFDVTVLIANDKANPHAIGLACK